MKAISKKKFFELIIGTASAKIGAVTYKGQMEISDEVVLNIAQSVRDEKYRNVVHQQSNAIKFNDNSWFFFDKPKDCDSRKAFIYEISGNTFLSLVDHRPEYENQFGTPISEQTFALIYKWSK